ncbi:MAG: hypothetical protein R3C56_33240 [Pirellulaceae bacterium]
MGVDEAGYGPNLGPLVVAASLWKTPEDCSEQQFSHAMAKHFSTANWSPSCHHVPLGDSKKLYATRSGLATLEAGLLALQFSLAPDCTSLGQFIQRVVRPESIDELNSLDWYAGYAAEPIPSVLELTEVLRLSQLAQSNLAPVGIELVDLKATIVCEPHFNQAVAKSGSKGNCCRGRRSNWSCNCSSSVHRRPKFFAIDKVDARTICRTFWPPCRTNGLMRCK